MTKLLSTMSLALITALLLFADPLRGEVLHLQNDVPLPPVVPEPPDPSPFSPSPSDLPAPPRPAQKSTTKAYRPKIIYRSHPLHRQRHLVCLPTQEVVLYVKDPVRCCVAEIPVCLPACCATPCVKNASGLLHRGVVCYDWDCGVRVKIVFRRKGDVLVHYYGI